MLYGQPTMSFNQLARGYQALANMTKLGQVLSSRSGCMHMLDEIESAINRAIDGSTYPG